MSNEITVREATAADADAIGALIIEFQEYLRRLGDQTEFAFDANTYLRDGFGANPAFAGLVAEVNQAIAGYALYHHGYETDRGRRVVHLIDLYVQHGRRRNGVGRALMQTLSELGRENNAKLIVWAVYQPNELAARFYLQIGGRYLKGLDWMVLDI